MSTGASASNPCYGCKKLEWVIIGHVGDAPLRAPYCSIDYCIATERCDEFPKDKT